MSSAPTVRRTPFETRLRLCPDLPTLWIREVTCLGDMYWTTRSTAPMSMPSSSVEVQTSALISPVLNAVSTLSRSSRGSEPWWTPTSPRILLSFSPSISAVVLLFTKTSVDLCDEIRSLILASLAARSIVVKISLETAPSSGLGVGYSTK